MRFLLVCDASSVEMDYVQDPNEDRAVQGSWRQINANSSARALSRIIAGTKDNGYACDVNVNEIYIGLAKCGD